MSQQGITKAAVIYNHDQNNYLLLTPNESNPTSPTWSWTSNTNATKWTNILEFEYYLKETSLGTVSGPWEIRWLYFDTVVTP